MRERAGMTGREAARMLGVNPMQISHLEVGRIGASEERVRRLASQYHCSDTALIDALCAMTYRQPKGWWEGYKGVLLPELLDLAEMEHHARALKTLQVVHVPGLLQTEAYIRAIHTYLVPPPPEEYLDAIVQFRLQRRRVLDRETAPRLDVILHEAALRTRVGNRTQAREQLAHLLEAADRPTVSVRVIPFEVDGFAGSGYCMHYADGTVPQLDTVQLDTAHGSIFLDAEAALDSYRNLYAKFCEAALPPAGTQDLISRIRSEM